MTALEQRVRMTAFGREHQLGFLLQSGHTPDRLVLD